MKTIYFVRHGQSEGNVSAVFQMADSPLSDVGRQQAEFVADRCKRLPIDVIVSSDQLRARNTAEIIASKTGHTVEVSELFRERRKPEDLEGKPFGDPEAERINEGWWESLIDAGPRAGDGENFQDLKKRALAALQYLADRPEQHILVVTHGFYMRYILACAVFGDQLEGKIFDPFARTLVMENTGITVLRHGVTSRAQAWGKSSKWQLWMWNDHAHLG